MLCHHRLQRMGPSNHGPDQNFPNCKLTQAASLPKSISCGCVYRNRRLTRTEAVCSDTERESPDSGLLFFFFSNSAAHQLNLLTLAGGWPAVTGCFYYPGLIYEHPLPRANTFVPSQSAQCPSLWHFPQRLNDLS